MAVEKKPFRKYKLDEGEGREDFSKSIWMNQEMRELLFDVGCMLRQSQISTIIRQSLEIAQAKLIGEEKIAEILYGNGTRNKRKGLDDIDLVQRELKEILSNSHSKQVGVAVSIALGNATQTI